MHFDIEKFSERLKEKPLSKKEAFQAIYYEINDAQSQKLAFVDQAVENPEFYRFLSSKIEYYITCLKMLHSSIETEDLFEFDE